MDALPIQITHMDPACLDCLVCDMPRYIYILSDAHKDGNGHDERD